MAYVTPKTNWLSSDGVTTADLNRIEENTRVLSQQGNAFGVATGTANTYSVTATPAITSLFAGAKVTVQINVANTGASTINVNGLGAKSILKPKGTVLTASNLVVDGVYSLVYNGTSFILQGEGGEYGTAVAGEVLSGKTIGTESGLVTGTMANNGAGGTVTPGTTNQTKSAGYYSSIITITGDADLVTGNIKAGVDIFGVIGKSSVVETSDANAIAANILSTKTAYVNGAKITGTASGVLTTAEINNLISTANNIYDA